jgi:hypothetical protein
MEEEEEEKMTMMMITRNYGKYSITSDKS